MFLKMKNLIKNTRHLLRCVGSIGVACSLKVVDGLGSPRNSAAFLLPSFLKLNVMASLFPLTRLVCILGGFANVCLRHFADLQIVPVRIMRQDWKFF
ncbi:hypothetical protein VTI28DRAFT_4291 [Corynascus sepedonium]